MNRDIESGSQKKESVLDAAILIFGRYGYKKTTVDDIAKAAKLSKQGLYLHFSSKREIFLAANMKYLDDGLLLVEESLARENTSLHERVSGAMDAWFGRHFATFSPESFDVIAVGNQFAEVQIEKYKDAFRSKIAKALGYSPEFKRSKNIGTPEEIAQVLFMCGLTWKESHESRADFMKKMVLCVKVCCQVKK